MKSTNHLTNERMPGEFTAEPWMVWLLAAAAVLAVAGLIVSRLRARSPDISDGGELRIQPTSSLSLGGASKSGRPEKPFLPPPAPLSSPGSPETEKRAFFRRVGNAVLVQVAEIDHERHPFNAWIVDRSRQGLRFAAERQLRVGSLYSVRPMQAPPSVPWCAVEVRHCLSADGHWLIGCRFLLPPPIQVMLLFG